MLTIICLRHSELKQTIGVMKFFFLWVRIINVKIFAWCSEEINKKCVKYISFLGFFFFTCVVSYIKND